MGSVAVSTGGLAGLAGRPYWDLEGCIQAAVQLGGPGPGLGLAVSVVPGGLNRCQGTCIFPHPRTCTRTCPRATARRSRSP